MAEEGCFAGKIHQRHLDLGYADPHGRRAGLLTCGELGRQVRVHHQRGHELVDQRNAKYLYAVHKLRTCRALAGDQPLDDHIRHDPGARCWGQVQLG